jgi:hypothetical protein
LETSAGPGEPLVSVRSQTNFLQLTRPTYHGRARTAAARQNRCRQFRNPARRPEFRVIRHGRRGAGPHTWQVPDRCQLPVDIATIADRILSLRVTTSVRFIVQSKSSGFDKACDISLSLAKVGPLRRPDILRFARQLMLHWRSNWPVCGSHFGDQRDKSVNVDSCNGRVDRVFGE